MRTYILSIFDKKNMQRASFRCEAKTFAEAISKAEESYPGFFAVLRTSFEEGAGNESVNA